jgi:diguanylate cyclase (GGDEF)-like protein
VTPAVVVLAVVAIILSLLVWWGYQRAARAERELARRIDVDTSTGLPNRRALRDLLAPVLQDARRRTTRVAVFALEIRGFGRLDETYGHEVGDALLTAAAQELRKALRPKDILVRDGGPRFVAAVDDVPDARQATDLAAGLLSSVERIYEVGEDRIRLRASVGVTITDQAVVTVDDVLLDAAVALDQARVVGQDDVQLLDHTMRSTRTPSTAEHQLRSALDRGEFLLLYLPVVDLRDRGIVGVEALLRWADPERGLVSPSTFLRTLDETGLIVPVGAWVVAEVARQSRVWQDELPSHPDLATTFNVSPRQLAQSDFIDTLRAAISESGVDASRLCLEVAEGTIVQEPDEVWATLRQAKQLGCSLTLDDFGTGHSSLQHLRQFRLDSLKIAKTFVDGLPGSPEDTAIVEHVVGLARTLGMRPVAEGVEHLAQVGTLRGLGCDLGQGYLFSTPQPADVITRLVREGPLTEDRRPDPYPGTDGGRPGASGSGVR